VLLDVAISIRDTTSFLCEFEENDDFAIEDFINRNFFGAVYSFH
jgi:hypothetical protein